MKVNELRRRVGWFFKLKLLKRTYVCNNFVTVSKEFNYAWETILLPLKEFIKEYVANGSEIIREGYAEAMLAFEAENSLHS